MNYAFQQHFIVGYVFKVEGIFLIIGFPWNFEPDFKESFEMFELTFHEGVSKFFDKNFIGIETEINLFSSLNMLQ